jgi:two-component system response regulator AtoC
VSATNRDLAADVAAGRFRDDLYWRINVVAVHLPPLRERREDIPELALHFLRRHRERLGLAVDRIGPAAQRLLMAHAWPGNVRELENVIERALVLVSGPEIGADDVADLVAAAPPLRAGASSAGGAVDGEGDLSVKRRTVDLERNLIRRALERTGGNRTRAAQLLELSHRALLYKIRDYGLGE